MSNAHMMLTTSDKTIKLWRVETKHLHQLSFPRAESNPNTPLRIPRVTKHEQVVAAKPRRVACLVWHTNRRQSARVPVTPEVPDRGVA